MVATLNYDAKKGMRTLYQGDRWGVLSVLILHSNGEAHAWPTTRKICDCLDRCNQTVLDARLWLLEHKAVELIPYEKRTGQELKLPRRQFVYRLTGSVEIDGEVIPYLYTQEPETEGSELPEDSEPEVLPDRTSPRPPEVLPHRSSTGQNQSISSIDSTESIHTDSSFVPQEESFSAVGESLPENYLPIYEWDIPDCQNEGLIHKAVYGTYGNQACLCGYANAGRTMKEPGARYVECAACFEAAAFSESETPESQLTKGSRKNDPAETIIPSGYKLLTSANLAEPLHLIAADKSRLAQPLCKKPFSYRMFPTPVISQARTPCADCWRIATTPKPTTAKAERKPQPWDAFALAVAQAGFKGVNDKFVGFVLHGVEKQNCRGIIAVECDLQGKERADLDFQALAALVPQFWRDYQAQNPGKELRDCSKWTSRWEGWRREQRAKAIEKAKPKPVAHIRFWKDPATGDERHEYCICAIGRNHDD